MTRLCAAHSMPMCRLCKEPDDRIEIPGSTLKARVKEAKPRKPLKKTKKRRPMKSDAMVAVIQEAMLRDGRCAVADYGFSTCRGQTDFHHLVSQRELSAHFNPDHAVFSDLRNGIAVCRAHHDQIERGFLRVPPEALPPGFYEFLKQYGFEAWHEAQIARRVA